MSRAGGGIIPYNADGFLDAGAFRGCRSLKKAETGRELNSVGNNAFRGCTSLKSFKGGMFLRSIGSNVFSGCRKLTKVSFTGNSLTSIGSGAFSGCVRLSSIHLPATVSRIGAKAFKGIASKAVIRVLREMVPAYSALLQSKGAPKNAGICSAR